MGNCSSTVTARPRRDSAQAEAAPINPAPMITMGSSATVKKRMRSATIVGAVTSEREFVAAHRDDLLTDLDQWLRIPGISAQPEYHPDVRRSAEWFADAARRTGFPTVEILDDG